MFISTNNLKKSYLVGLSKNEVLKGVTLSLEKGQIGVILGPSGSGKSTLMNIIGGVDKAERGSLFVDGVEISALSDDQLTNYRRESVGFVFQFYNLIPNLTARENVEVIEHISKSPLSISEVFKAVGLDGRQNSFPRELSGGEQQRVAIARAIVKNPKLLLCDEPTGALDYETSRDVLSLIQGVNHEFGTTILMITHNRAIGDMANIVFKLRSGEVTTVVENENPIAAERIQW